MGDLVSNTDNNAVLHPPGSPAGSRGTTVDQRCAQLAATVAIPQPFDIRVLVKHLNAHRRRPLRLRASDQGPIGLCGIVRRAPGADVVYYPASGVQGAEHAILHQIAHFLLDHTGTDLAVTEHDGLSTLQLLLPDLSPALVSRLFRQTPYSVDQEHQADQFAALVLDRITSAA